MKTSQCCVLSGVECTLGSPSICNDMIPILRRADPPFWLASDFNRSAISLGMFNVTLTLFHGSTFLITNCSSSATANLF